MSRNILSNREIPSEAKIQAMNKENSKLIFTRHKNRRCMLFIENNTLKCMHYIPNTNFVGGIYIGRIQKISPNKESCFVEIQKGIVCYLPYQNARNVLLLNRSFDASLKQGDLILVKVIKEGIKTKQPAITAEFNAFMPSDTDYSILTHKSVFSCICEPTEAWESIYKSYIAENEYSEVITDDSEIFNKINTFFTTRGKRVRFYEDKTLSLAALYSLDTKCNAAINRTVWLKSGAYLVIDQTEAFTIIDINSGKNIKKSEPEEFVKMINYEAADEIAIQIRLRNLSGIILIDFLNFHSRESEKELLQYMKELVNDSAVKITVHDITRLGIMELTRVKQGKSLAEQINEA